MNANDTDGTMKDFARETGKALGRAEEYTKNAAGVVRDEAKELAGQGAECARNNFLSGIATAFVGGLILGFVLSRRERPSFRKQYVGEPLERAQEVALALLAPINRALREQYKTARSVAQDAADRISGVRIDPEPVLKQTRELGKRLKFW